MGTVSRIPEKLFFKIGEVCELIKVQPHVLRYWETEFPMLAPQKNRAGQRVYRRKDVEMVLRIRDLLYEEKFTIAGAKKKLADEMRGSVRGRPATKEPAAIKPPLEPFMEPIGSRVERTAAEPSLPGLTLPQPDQPGFWQPEESSNAAPAREPDRPQPPAGVRPREEPTAQENSGRHGAPANGVDLPPEVRRAFRIVKRDLEDLLTLLSADARVKR